MAKDIRSGTYKKIIRGVEASAASAVSRAREFSTDLVVFRNGKIVKLEPSKVRANAVKKKS
jgi:hypothetical protein